jgi:hypothetical protein
MALTKEFTANTRVEPGRTPAPRYQVIDSPVGTVNTGTESCSGNREGVVVTVSRETFPHLVTK